MPATRAAPATSPLRRFALAAGLAVVALGCNPNTTRPPFGPLPQALAMELELPMGYATEVTAEALRVDSIPVTRVEARDGYLETGWFEARTGVATAARPVGVEVVRVRGWATPGRVGHTDFRLEAVYRPLADPSRPGRDLERLLPVDHPVSRRMAGAVRKLVEQFGDPSQLAVPEAPAPDSAARPDTLVRPDTTRPDTTRPRPDTLAVRYSVIRRILEGK